MFPIAKTPVKQPKIKSILLDIYVSLCSIFLDKIAYKVYKVNEPIVEPIEK